MTFRVWNQGDPEPSDRPRCSLCGCHHQHDDADVVGGPRGCLLCRYCFGGSEVRGVRAGTEDTR